MIFNPAHPGEVLRDYLGTMTIREAGARLRITRAHLSRILNGQCRYHGAHVFTLVGHAWNIA